MHEVEGVHSLKVGTCDAVRKMHHSMACDLTEDQASLRCWLGTKRLLGLHVAASCCLCGCSAGCLLELLEQGGRGILIHRS
jgi:hypothetical protein